MNFQQVIHRLNEFWADQGCVIWQPHNVQVGAGTANPATILRVLGPEPWNVAYPEPSVRPADGRYGENPNRWQEYYQYQVILKPDPGNPIDLYLQSLSALGIEWRKHDIRFVEDNWQSPSLGAWGLGWEIWLDGLEITQYTYFQQACGIDLDPVSVEITYGLERIVMYLQGARRIPDIQWLGDIRYGDLHLADEIAYCHYNFNHADVERLSRLYELNEAEANVAIAHGLVLPAHDYLLKCSHLFNVMDARGAIGVSQRAHYFGRMRKLAGQIAQLYIQQREQAGFPLGQRQSAAIERMVPGRRNPVGQPTGAAADFVLEVGVEELPAGDLAAAVEQLRRLLPERLKENRLVYRDAFVGGTPRRLVIYLESLATAQADSELFVKGPPAHLGFDAQGQPTQAAEGFARRHGAAVSELTITEIEGTPYTVFRRVEKGQLVSEILPGLLSNLIASLKFALAMRWNETGVTFARPIRWLLALHGEALIDVECAGVSSDRYSYGLRAQGSPEIKIERAEVYRAALEKAGIEIDGQMRQQEAWRQITALAAQVGGVALEDPALLAEVANLVESPAALLGYFDSQYLSLPREVLITVMKKHQRYFPLGQEREDRLLPCFITVVNGNEFDHETVRRGNEAVLDARFADAIFFYQNDLSRPLADYAPQLAGLTFQERLGSYLDKTARLQKLALILGERLALSTEDMAL
ncbi:MAG: glycine--tRNA ligase subunit alpha, partial [Chloroflexi bacterium]|nr:glycine--tRNA ligase subunit alpha [Chloroflexota bacterium]